MKKASAKSSPRFRIAHFIHSDGPGGGPVVVTQLLEGLKADYEQMVFCDGEGRLHSFCQDHGLPCEKIRLGKKWQWPLAIIKLARRFREHQLDLVILHGQWAGPLGALAAKRAGIRHTIYVAHCPAFYHSTTLFRAIRNYIAEKIPCRLASRVVTLSDGNHYNYLFRGWAPESHLVRIHNGIDLSVPSVFPEQTSFRKKHGLDPACRHCVFVGRLDDQKRPDWMIETWAEALSLRGEEQPPWHLWMVGGGRERRLCEDLAKSRGVEETVHFVGEQPDGLPWIQTADLVAMTSVYEGHALVPLEAMASSLPVVAFITDGITDSVRHGHNGLLCEIGDVAALGSHVAELLSHDEKRRAMGKSGRELLTKQFPLADTITNYRTLIRNLLTHET